MLAIWLPSVFLGVVAQSGDDVPHRRARAHVALPGRLRRSARYARGGDDVICGWSGTRRSGGAAGAVMAAVMASDSQILALSTMFTEDVFAFYGGTRRFGEAVQVRTGRIFVVLLTLVGVSDRAARAAVDLRPGDAVRLCRLRRADAAARGGALLAAQHQWGALASTVWTAAAVAGVAVLQIDGAGAAAGIAGDDPGDRRSRYDYAGRRTARWCSACCRSSPMTVISAAADGRWCRLLTPAARPGRHNAWRGTF